MFCTLININTGFMVEPNRERFHCIDGLENDFSDAKK